MIFLSTPGMISVQEGWVGQTRGSVMGKELCRKGSATVVDGNAYVTCYHAPKKTKLSGMQKYMCQMHHELVGDIPSGKLCIQEVISRLSISCPC